MPSPSHSSQFDYPNSIWWRIFVYPPTFFLFLPCVLHFFSISLLLRNFFNVYWPEGTVFKAKEFAKLHIKDDTSFACSTCVLSVVITSIKRSTLFSFKCKNIKRKESKTLSTATL
jgi:hypothetical protein